MVRPADVLVIIEVADSSLEYDRDVKAPIYANAGIPEYWLVDLDGGLLSSCVIAVDAFFPGPG